MKIGIFFTMASCVSGLVDGFNNCDPCIVRGRRVRGLSTPDKATESLTSVISTGVSIGASVRSIHYKRVPKVRAVNFRKLGSHVAVRRRTFSHRNFTTNTIRTTLQARKLGKMGRFGRLL